MSAFLVSDRHIDLLVSAAVAFSIIDREDADKLGQCLVTENYLSLAQRYGDDPTPHEYHHRPYACEDPATIVKAIGCWDYQSCEHSTFRDSQVAAWMSELGERVARVGGWDSVAECEHSPQWAAAPWEIDEDDEVFTR